MVAQGEEFTGLYPGNPGRGTDRPTTELIFRAFRQVTFTWLAMPSREVRVVVTASIDPVALEAAERRLGWRVYATNLPTAQLSLTAAVFAYREQYQIEHSFGRLNGRPLSLQPMYLVRDDHATGLVRLFCPALRVLSVLEFQVRCSLVAAARPLRGLYPDNPGRGTRRPSTELLLRAFGQITLTRWEGKETLHGTCPPSSRSNCKILQLLDLPVSIYTSLTHRNEEPG